RKKIPKKINKAVEDYIALLKKDKLPIGKVILFGSSVKGTAHKNSDIDIAIISSYFRDSEQSMKYLLKKAHELGRNDIVIEPHGFHPREFVDANPLAWEIKKTGVRFD
ncbi:nucleotidyltransferase domain-containing protein, partial [Candidatus Uhrbacteria bacterium]|nr:nucleotidyltransferase domain-containing protein [Candidatus Uhrbacteria bacterium]